MMAISTDVPAATPSTNGELIDRVQQLRLKAHWPAARPGPAGGRGCRGCSVP